MAISKLCRILGSGDIGDTSYILNGTYKFWNLKKISPTMLYIFVEQRNIAAYIHAWLHGDTQGLLLIYHQPTDHRRAIVGNRSP